MYHATSIVRVLVLILISTVLLHANSSKNEFTNTLPLDRIESAMMSNCAFSNSYPSIPAGNRYLSSEISETSSASHQILWTTRLPNGNYTTSTSFLNGEGIDLNVDAFGADYPSLNTGQGGSFYYTAEAETSTTIKLISRRTSNDQLIFEKIIPIDQGLNFSGQLAYVENAGADKLFIYGRVENSVDFPIPVMFFAITDGSGNLISQNTTEPAGGTILSLGKPYFDEANNAIFTQYDNFNSRVAGALSIDVATATFNYIATGEGDLVTTRYALEGIAPDNTSYYETGSGRANNFTVVRKRNVSDGSIIWEREVSSSVTFPPNPFFTSQTIQGQEITSDGGIIVGYTYNDGFDPNFSGFHIVKYDANGNVVWNRTDPNWYNDYGRDYVVSDIQNDDGFFLKYFDSETKELNLVKFDNNGQRLPECGGGGSCNVAYTFSSGAITITGLSSDANTKLFDSNTQAVWSCNPWQGNPCSSSNVTIPGLVAGATYFLSVQSSVCDEWIPITLDGGNTATCSDGIQNQGETGIDCGGPCAPCNDGGCNVNITSSNGGVTITGLTSDANTKLFNSNISAVWSCNPWQGNPCSNNETVSGLTTGATYFLSVQSDDCEEWIPIVIQGGGGCPDADSDGTCDTDDCQPNNPALPAVVGSSCNDNNSNTTNDVIQSNGCTCQGTPTGGGCNVNITSSNGGVTITGLTSDANTKLFNSNISAVWSCNPWQGNPCSNNETVSGLTTGATYFLSVQSDDCEEWIPITIQGGGGGNGPDLLTSAPNIGTGAPGSILSFTFDLTNQGNTTATGSYFIRSYISTDATLSNNDIQEGSIQTGNTPVGSTNVTGAITVPNLAAGTYYLFLVVDDSNMITEANENNNVKFSTFSISSNLNFKNSAQETTPITIEKLFPNPTSGELFAQIESPLDGDLSISIVNVLGQVNLQQTKQIETGSNTILLDLENLTNGIYNVIFQNGKETITKQFVIAK